jgi:glutathione S-transferase
MRATEIVRNSRTLPFLVMRSSPEAIPTPPALLTHNRVIKGSAAIAEYLQSIEKKLSVQNHRIQTTLAALRNLGISPSLATFNDRLRIQKVIYLLQAFGLRTRWNFSWYLRGPYSPDLAYAIFNTDLKSVTEAEFKAEGKQVIEKLRSYFKLEDMSVADLEAAASILYVAGQRREPWTSEKELAEEVFSKKPMLNRSKVNKYISLLWSQIPHDG